MNILVIGECGTGKTWVCSNLIEKLNLDKQDKVGLIRYHHNDDVMLMGIYDGSLFQGTDKLSMAVMSDVDELLEHGKDKIIIAEGDRFTNSKYIEKANPLIVRIIGDGSKGRKLRESSQTDRQIKSIKTRVNNIVLKNNMNVVNAKDSSNALEIILDCVKNKQYPIDIPKRVVDEPNDLSSFF